MLALINIVDAVYVRLCVPDIVKNINIKVFHLMSRANGTRFIAWHESCKCKCRLDSSVSNFRQQME